MNPVVEYIESEEYLLVMRNNSLTTIAHRSPYAEAAVFTHGGVTAVRPMFELIDDHESMNEDGLCWMCK